MLAGTEMKYWIEEVTVKSAFLEFEKKDFQRRIVKKFLIKTTMDIISEMCKTTGAMWYYMMDS